MNFFNSRNGWLALLGFGVALVVFLGVMINLWSQVSQTNVASAPAVIPTALDAPTATPTLPPPSPTLIPSPTFTPTRVAPTRAPTDIPKPTATPAPTNLPVTVSPTASTLPRQTYSTLTILSPVTDHPAASHADLNLALRGYVPAKFALDLEDLEGSTDGEAPQLSSLLTGSRDPVVKAVYRVNNWDWGCNCRGKSIDDPEVSLVGLAVKPGEPIYTPHANLEIGNKNQVLVLFADADSITLVYTRNDNVTKGYTVHLAGITVAPDLLALYQQLNNAGRASLPALREYQPLGAARTDEIKVAVRDTGAFMDPRSRKDWWRDKPKITKPGLAH